MSKKKSLVRQAAVLSVSNGATRALGFVMRVALSRRLGAEGTGVLELASSAHMLWIAPVTAGLPMAVSTETAAGRGGEALHAGRRLALRVSLLMLPALFVLSPLIARLLGDARTLPALWCYLPCLPVLGLSAVYNGWCYGAGDTLPPAASELTEQALRFALCMGLLTVFPRMRAAYTAAVPALSTLLGEGAGLLLVVWMLKKQGTLPAGRASAETEKKLWRLSAPMTWMRLSNTLTRTAGAVLIPLRLRAAGLSAQEATARLGMLSGMAMPWVMLPGVFTGALAVVAGPAIAKRRHSPEMLRALAVRLIAAALAISAPLAPLCGAQQVLSGILTGMEMQRSLLASSLSGSLLTLVLDFFLVKKFRLAGCALARLAGHGLTLYMNLCAFSAELRKRRDAPTPPLKG